ncbi:tetratricopeptide repeat protein [Roseivirga pacifica]|uniref:tetratricopeptide repeat protein n=1 Tax=Roseivirga pacifica TaxID=1267423 RepID=UPI003BA87BB1
MKKHFISGLMLSAMLIATACDKKEQTYELKDFQGLSLLGDSLNTPNRTTAQVDALTASLNEAKAKFEANPSEMNTIWLGRRYAYLSYYQKAIAVFSAGLKQHPNSYKLYRHRGHRYISLRQFDKAIADFEKAYELMPKGVLETEPDGAPNKLNIPLSNTQFNVLYHYGLAHYLKGEFAKAEPIYEELLANYCDNLDLFVATTDWLYMTLKRQNKDEEAEKLLTNILTETKVLETAKELTEIANAIMLDKVLGYRTEIIENDSYYKRLLMYRGELPVEELFKTNNEDVALSLATQGYGVANWYLYNGDTAKAKEILSQVLSGTSWAAFGYIAAEADMKRLD